MESWAGEFWRPILELIGRYEDRLPPWMQGHTRWIGVVVLAVLLGAIANRLLSLMTVFFHGSDFGRWLGDVFGI